MFCEKCGNELDNNQTMCPNCGESTEVLYDNSSLEENNNYNFDMNDTNLKKSGSKKVILFTSIIVMIIAATLTVLAFTSNAFKSPKQIYLSTEGKNIQEKIENLKDDGTFVGNIIKLSEHAHETEREYSLNVDLDSLSLNLPLLGQSLDLSSITSVLKNSKVVVNQKSDPNKNQQLMDVDILVNNTKFFDFLAAFENDVLALSVPVLFDKYLVADLSQAGNAVENLDLPEWINKFSSASSVITPKDILQSLSFEEKKLENIKKDYSKVLKNSIDKEQVSMEKNVQFKVGEFDLKCNKLTIKFEKEDLQRVIINLVDATAENDGIYELIKENIDNIYELLKSSNFSDNLGDIEKNKAEFSKEKFKEGINEIKTGLEKSFENLVLPEGITMSVFTNKKEIVGRTINAKIKTADSDETVGLSVNFSGVADYKNRNIKDLEIKLNYDDNSNISNTISEIIFEYNLDGNLDKETESGKKDFSVAVGSGGFSTKVFKLNSDYNITSDSKSNSQETSHDYDVSVGVPMMFSIDANGNLTVNKWENAKEKQFGNDIDFSLNLDIPANILSGETSIGLDFNSKTKNTLDVTFDFPSFDSENSIDITNASEEEISQLKTQIETSIKKFVENNLELINLFQQF